MDEFLSFVNIEKNRVLVLPTGRWFIKDFFVFQYGDKFSPTSAVHKGALKSLLQNGVHPKEILGDSIGKLQLLDLQELKEIAYNKDIDTLNIAFGNPSIRVKDKDKDKDKDIKKGGTGENKIMAELIDEEFAYFRDGTKQPLGNSQKLRFKNGDLKNEDVAKGYIV